MMNDFEKLFDGWVAGTLTKEEVDVFMEQVVSDTPLIPPLIDQLLPDLAARGIGNEELRERLFKQLSDKLFSEQQPVRRLFSTAAKWMVAAVFILVAGTAIWYIAETGKQTAPQPVETAQNNKLIPGGNKAVLVLGNGSEIILDSSAEGQLARQNGTTIFKSGSGQLTYKQSTTAGENQAAVFNTLSTPRGGQYKLVLPDGTNVWLNAASSITYPAAFTGNERLVSITGEAYFEVARTVIANSHEKMPFKVRIPAPSGDGKHLEITVLGTHFNVNAYADEPSVNTTLLEGSVKLKKDTDQYLLQPGQQAKLNKSGNLKIVADINTDEIMAWKNGYFYFEHSDLQTVMRQIARWYDVSIEYRGAIPEMTFAGEFPRNSDAADMLKILEGTKLHFVVEGKKIIIMP